MKRSDMEPEPTMEETIQYMILKQKRWSKQFLRENTQKENMNNLKEQPDKLKQQTFQNNNQQ